MRRTRMRPDGARVGDQPGLTARPLLPPGARRPAAVIAVCCALITLVIGILVTRAAHPDALDRSVDAWIRARVAGHVRALTLVEDLAEPAQVAVVTALIVLACLAARRVKGALLAAISVLLAAGLTEFVLKPLFDRHLNGYLVYPSGHTCRIFTLAAVLTVLALNPPRRRPPRVVKIAIAVAGALAGTAVAVAMIGLGYHYFTDTIGGAALGIGVVAATTFLLDRYVSRNEHAGAGRWRRGP
jgi:membrane-associated phospholipid phosphatase